MIITMHKTMNNPCISAVSAPSCFYRNRFIRLSLDLIL